MSNIRTYGVCQRIIEFDAYRQGLFPQSCHLPAHCPICDTRVYKDTQPPVVCFGLTSLSWGRVQVPHTVRPACFSVSLLPRFCFFEYMILLILFFYCVVSILQHISKARPPCEHASITNPKQLQGWLMSPSFHTLWRI